MRLAATPAVEDAPGGVAAPVIRGHRDDLTAVIPRDVTAVEDARQAIGVDEVAALRQLRRAVAREIPKLVRDAERPKMVVLPGVVDPAQDPRLHVLGRSRGDWRRMRDGTDCERRKGSDERGEHEARTREARSFARHGAHPPGDLPAR